MRRETRFCGLSMQKQTLNAPEFMGSAPKMHLNVHSDACCLVLSLDGHFTIQAIPWGTGARVSHSFPSSHQLPHIAQTNTK